jgi:hypothetical protein
MPLVRGAKKATGISRHGFRSAAEVALAHWERENGRKLKRNEELKVEFRIRGENPVRDYIAVL